MMCRLKFITRLDVCYGSVSLFTAILHNIFLLYHVDMFISIYKIDKSAFWIGETVFLLWNSINDPLFGWFSDRKYLAKTSVSRSIGTSQVVLDRLNALKWNCPLFAVSFMAFWISWAHPAVQFVICLCLYDGFLTMIDLHHSALLADLAVSSEDRTKLNSKCSIFSALGSVSVFLSYLFWNKESLTHFRFFCAALAISSFAGFSLTTRLLERLYCKRKNIDDLMPTMYSAQTSVAEESSAVCQPYLRTYVREVLSQRNFIWFSMMNLVQVFHCHFNSNFFALFLQNLLGDAISPGFGSFLLGVSFVAPHINNLFFLSLCRRYGVYFVICLLFITKLLLSLTMFLFGIDHVWLLCLFITSNRVFTEGTCKLLNLVISDLVDEDFVIHRRDQAASALMFGTAALLSKPGQTLAPLIGTWLLSAKTGNDIFSSGKEAGAVKMNLPELDHQNHDFLRQSSFQILVYVAITCAVLQLALWSRFSLHGRRLHMVKSLRASSHCTV